MASAIAGPVRAQDVPGADAATRLKDPIELAADQILTWENPQGRWFLLTGASRVAVLQGIDEGIRAQQAVVRVTPLDGPDQRGFQAEVYAEGDAVPFGYRKRTLPSVTRIFQSLRDVRLRPYDKNGITKLPEAPRYAAIVHRAFPGARSPAVGVAPGPDQTATSGPAPPAITPAPAAGRAESPAAAPRPTSLVRKLQARFAGTGDALSPATAARAPVSPQSGPVPVAALPPLTTPPPLSGDAPAPAQVASPSPGGAPDPLPQAVLPAPSSPIQSPSASALQEPTDRVVRADGASIGAANAAPGPPVRQAQFDPFGPLGDVGGMANEAPPPLDLGPKPANVEDTGPVEEAPVESSPPGPGAGPPLEAPGTNLQPFPGTNGGALPPLNRESIPDYDPKVPYNTSPILPGTQRITRIFPRTGGPDFSFETLRTQDGVSITVIRGGVEIVCEAKQFGIIDVSADSAIIWRQIDPKAAGGVLRGPNGEVIDNAGAPMEVYLEGHVVFMQDERKVAGNGDQKTFRANQAYYDFRTGRFVGLQGEINMFAPGMVAPARVFAPRIDQFRPLKRTPDGKLTLGLERIQTDNTVTTGSRFPTPGYSFTSQSLDLTRVVSTQTNPNTGRPVGNPRDPKTPDDLTWRIDAKQNIYWMGNIPFFYYPRFRGNADDLQPPLSAFIFRTNNYFGQQFLVDLNGFRVFGLRQPKWIDSWNIDIDELTARGLAVGTEVGWFGRGLLADLTDPYRLQKRPGSDPGGEYFGYFDIWGLQDHHNDVLGPGPAVITNNNAEANVGFQRTNVPAFQKYRGKITFRHMQSFLEPDAEQDEDYRLQLEVGYSSDRNFLEEYYKRIFDTGLDQETLAYLIRQKENRAWELWTEANLNPWQTESQWLPKLDYYRFGDSLLGNRITYFQHSGADYANTHPATEVNNPHIFAFLPYDPISNTSQVLRAGRFYTNHEIDVPFQFDFLRIIPYVQGQAVGWTNQIGGEAVGRVWGGAGARASIMAWRAFPGVESELFNIHGLNHKLNFDVDARAAWSNVRLDRIGVQDDLDDNTYEYTRRYFALTDYAGGLLPQQFDPRHLILRRMTSPISGTTDVQATINTVAMNLHQRLQTKRGPEGRRRVIDYMTLDLSTIYFPTAGRDNFGKPFGQNMYNWQWFLGDRTSIISYGWFEFWNLGGQPLFTATNAQRHNNPFGLNVITSGISISRPPRGNVFIGYTVIDTGPINTSALTTSLSYWLSPKWYGSYSTMYDFGNAILLGSMFSFTRIGADYLTTIGLTVDPQRNSYMAAFMLSPRISPNVRLGSGMGMNQFDSRYAPTQ